LYLTILRISNRNRMTNDCSTEIFRRESRVCEAQKNTPGWMRGFQPGSALSRVNDAGIGGPRQDLGDRRCVDTSLDEPRAQSGGIPSKTGKRMNFFRGGLCLVRQAVLNSSAIAGKTQPKSDVNINLCLSAEYVFVITVGVTLSEIRTEKCGKRPRVSDASRSPIHSVPNVAAQHRLRCRSSTRSLRGILPFRS
jgi:hypothetical protein